MWYEFIFRLRHGFPPFRPIRAPHACALCGSRDTYLDEVITDDRGGRLFVCSDTDFCAERQADAAKEAAE